MDKTPIIYISIVGLMIIIISVMFYSKIKKLEDNSNLEITKLVNDSNLKITNLANDSNLKITNLANDSNLKIKKLEDDMDTKSPILNPVFKGSIAIGRDPAKFDDNDVTNHNHTIITPVPGDSYIGSYIGTSIGNNGGLMYSVSMDPKNQAPVVVKTTLWDGQFYLSENITGYPNSN